MNLQLLNEVRDIIERIKVISPQFQKDEHKDIRHLLYQETGYFGRKLSNLMKEYIQLENKLSEKEKNNDKSTQESSKQKSSS